ncbi:MAG TPA: hypothetical protein PLN01_09505, partial [Spirochaetota bacterium]|nr:hypothetical protein [Spirochaetota bacterium]
MKKACFLLLLCTILLLSCSGSKHKNEAIINGIDIPVRIYPAGVTVAGEDGREQPSGDSILAYDTSITSTWHVLEKSVITFQC